MTTQQQCISHDWSYTKDREGRVCHYCGKYQTVDWVTKKAWWFVDI